MKFPTDKNREILQENRGFLMRYRTPVLSRLGICTARPSKQDRVHTGDRRIVLASEESRARGDRLQARIVALDAYRRYEKKRVRDPKVASELTKSSFRVNDLRSL